MELITAKETSLLSNQCTFKCSGTANMAAGIKFWIMEKMGPVGVILIIRCIKKISGQIKNATNRRICDSRNQGNARKKHTHTDRDWSNIRLVSGCSRQPRRRRWRCVQCQGRRPSPHSPRRSASCTPPENRRPSWKNWRHSGSATGQRRERRWAPSGGWCAGCCTTDVPTDTDASCLESCTWQRDSASQ